MRWIPPRGGATTALPLLDTLGLRPLGLRLEETALALRGDPNIPPSRFGLSTLRVFRPRVSLPTWLGLRRADRRVPITNLFNHRPTPPEEGWSVRVTSVEDFRGGRLTYDSHNGTDLAVPVGTTVTAPAPGQVLRVSSEYHRGGLKVFIDHGGGVATSCNHLGRALVREGDLVARGQPVALSAYSGLDGLVSFPWVAPHVHFNVFLDGRHVDPFARRGSGDVPLWLDNEPRPAEPEAAPTAPFSPTALSMAGVEETILSCRDPALHAELAATESPLALQGALLFQTTYFPTRFSARPPLYAERHQRRPLLGLPLSPDDYSGLWFVDR